MDTGVNLENLHSIIKDKFNRLKDLDYRELIKMNVDPKDLHFSVKPIKFEAFFESKRVYNFLHELVSYCQLLIDIESRQSLLIDETKRRGLSPPKNLRSDIQEVMNRGKNLATRYSLILLEFITDKKKQTIIDFHTFKRENELYEIFILLSVKVTQTFFEEEFHQAVEEEIHRLLRSGAFNEARRKNFELEKIRKYPILEEKPGKEPLDSIISKLIKRHQIPNMNWNFQYNNQKSDLKPNFTKMKPLEAKSVRSPLLSLIVPSTKYELNNFEKRRKDKVTSVVRPNSTLRHRAEAMIEQEIQKGRYAPTLAERRLGKKNPKLNNSVL